jgi:hypothetical protein
MEQRVEHTERMGGGRAINVNESQDAWVYSTSHRLYRAPGSGIKQCEEERRDGTAVQVVPTEKGDINKNWWLQVLDNHNMSWSVKSRYRSLAHLAARNPSHLYPN